MPIVLAIEPDRRQAAHVSAVVRHRVGAELILADTTEGALDAIGSRVPDLVLVPALLSPQDDAALAAALRVIAAAAHVRTLTIPVFASGSGRTEGGGLLARFRRSRTETASVGCDPAVFAEQIGDYLREAAAERADLEASGSVDEPAPEPQVDESPFIESSFIESPVIEPTTVEPVRFIAPVVNSMPAPPQPPLDFVDAATAEFGERAFVDPPAVGASTSADEARADETSGDEARADETSGDETSGDETSGDETSDDDVVIDLSDEITDTSPEASDAAEEELFDGEPFGVYTLSLDESLDTPVEAVEALSTEATSRTADADVPGDLAAADADVLDECAAADADAVAQAPIVEPAASKPVDTSAWLALGLRYTRQWPTMEGAIVEAGATFTELASAPADRMAGAAPKPAESAQADAPPTPPIVAPAQAQRPDHLDWAELVASLRQDIERRRRQPAATAPIAPITPLAPRPAEVKPRPQLHAIDGAARRPRKLTPVQDEWGFFDPQQCGFAALLAKLDEFSEADEPDVRKTS